MSDDGWRRVAEAITARMDELVIDQAELVRRSGASDPTVRGLMKGTPRGGPNKMSRAKVCAGLGWTPGSIDRILEGGKPSVVHDRSGSVTKEAQDSSDNDARVVSLVMAAVGRLDERSESLAVELASLREQIAVLAARLPDKTP